MNGYFSMRLSHMMHQLTLFSIATLMAIQQHECTNEGAIDSPQIDHVDFNVDRFKGDHLKSLLQQGNNDEVGTPAVDPLDIFEKSVPAIEIQCRSRTAPSRRPTRTASNQAIIGPSDFFERRIRSPDESSPESPGLLINVSAA